MAWAFHWRAPLQTKGFLKIIEFFLAMLVFSLVAGFSLSGQVTCPPNPQNSSYLNSSFKVAYPFSSYSQYSSAIGGGPFHDSRTTFNGRGPFHDSRASSGAQFIVTWGVFTDFYCVAALLVYVFFTANENMEKIVDLLVYTDLACHVLWVVVWFIASVEWVVSTQSIGNTFNSILNHSSPSECTSSQDTNVQANIASVFAFLCMVLWGVNIYWVFIDTAFFIKWQAQRKSSNFENF